MGESLVIFRDNQELSAADLVNAQQWMGDALDHVVFDAINAGKAYTGFTAAKASQTTVTVQPGRLYNEGAVYAREDVVTLDLYNQLPVVTRKQYAVVAWGQTIETDVQPRNFLIDADTGASQPQAVAMEKDRYCNVELVPGIESADPQVPSTDASVTVIAWVLADTTGVISVTQNTENLLDNLSLVAERVRTIEAWRTIIEGMIATLRTDLANLAAQLLLYTPLTDFLRLVAIVNEIYNKLFRPGIYIWYGTERFLDESGSDVLANVDGAYSAMISEGLRFPGASAAVTTTLSLLNPTDPFAYVWDGMMFPKPSGERVRHDCSFPQHPWIEDRILQYVFWNFSVRVLKFSRWRHCCGPRFLPNPKAAVWWKTAKVDPIAVVLKFATETWVAKNWEDVAKHSDEDDPDWPRWDGDRDDYFWRDWVHLPYWSREFDTVAHSGQHIAQTFLNSQDGWMTSVSFYMHKATWQPLSVIITGCNAQDEPNISHTLCRVNVDGPTLQTLAVEEYLFETDIEIIDAPGLGLGRKASWYIKHGTKIVDIRIPIYVYATRIPIPPTYLRAGQRYTIHLVSAADHSFSICDKFEAFQVHQGHFWRSDGTALIIWPGNVTPKTLRFKTHFAVWGRWGDNPSNGGTLRYEIQLTPLQLAGGIGSIEVLTRSVIPEPCDVSYQVQIAGTWRAFASGPNAPDFTGNPALLPFRVVMTGTTDLMPAISLTPSQVTLRRAAATTFHHISLSITFGSASTHVKMIAKAHNFVTAHHTLTGSLHYGATNKAADVVEDETLPDGTLQRTWTFNTTSITAAVFKLDGTTDGVGDNFVVSEEIRFATA